MYKQYTVFWVRKASIITCICLTFFRAELKKQTSDQKHFTWFGVKRKLWTLCLIAISRLGLKSVQKPFHVMPLWEYVALSCSCHTRRHSYSRLKRWGYKYVFLRKERTLHVAALHFTHLTPFLTLVTYWLHTFLLLCKFLPLLAWWTFSSWCELSVVYFMPNTPQTVCPGSDSHIHHLAGDRVQDLPDLPFPYWIGTECVFMSCVVFSCKQH